MCWIRRENSNDPYIVAAPRTVAKMKELSEPCLKILENRERKRIKVAKDALKQISMKHIRPATWEIPLGANPKGIYGATPPEMLHQFDLGLLKRTHELLLAMMKAEADERIGTSFALRKRIMDSRLMAFNVRHCDNTMPRKRFTSGASEIVGFRAVEFAPLMWQLMVIMGTGTDGSLLYVLEKKRSVVKLLYTLMMLRTSLWKTSHSEADLPALDFTVRM